MESTIKLAIIISDLGGGGAQRVLINLINGWLGQHYKITVITFADPEGDCFTLPDGVDRIALGLARNTHSVNSAICANLQRIVSLRKAIKGCDSSVIISFIGVTNILTVIACFGLKKKVIISERNDPSRQFLGCPWDWLRKIIYPFADKVTANSQGAIVALEQYVDKRKLALVPNPVTIPDSIKQIDAKPPFFLAVGRLHPQKGYDSMLKAIKQSNIRKNGWRVVILGDGELRESLLQETESLGLSDIIEWKGHTNPFPYYQAAKAFMMTSRYEGMPNALIEALTFGLPSIITDASSGPLELVEDGETGIVVETDNYDEMKAAMNRIMEEPEYANSLGIKAKQRVKKKSLLPQVLKQWNQIILM